MQLQRKFFLTVSAIAVIVATFLLVANGGDGGRRMEAADVTADPALEPEQRELSRHWFKKTHNPNGLKTWRRNRWAFYVGKQKKGRAYQYYQHRPGWNPHPNKPNQKKSLRAAAAPEYPNRGLCSCSFKDNEGNDDYGEMTPKIFGNAFVCGACHKGKFKMAVMNSAGGSTTSVDIDCPSDTFTIDNLTEEQFNGARDVVEVYSHNVDFHSSPYTAFEGCPYEDGVQPGCSCTFRDNDGIVYSAMTPAIFGDDYICGACQGFGHFKMAVMDLAGQQTASKYFPCPSVRSTSADLTRADYDGASVVSNDLNFYTAPEVDFSSCPEDTGGI